MESPVLLVSAVALLLASVALLLCSATLLHIVIRSKPQDIARKPMPVQAPSSPPPTKPSPKKKVEKGPFCAYCNRKLPEKPERGIVSEEGPSLLVYKCKCGQETTLPDNSPESILQ